MRVRSVLPCLLVTGLVLGMATSCRKKKEVKIPRTFSEYYSADTTVIETDSIINGEILDDYICVQTYEESDEYRRSLVQYNSPYSSGDACTPVDDNGNPVQPDNHLLFYDLDGKEVSSFDMNEEFGRSLDYRRFAVSGNDLWALSKLIDEDGDYSWRVDKVDAKKGSVDHVDLEFIDTPDYIRAFFVDSSERICIIGARFFIDELTLSIFPGNGETKSILLPCTFTSNLVEWNGDLAFIRIDMENGESLAYRLDEKKMTWEEEQTGLQQSDRALVCDGQLFSYNARKIETIGEEKKDELLWASVSVFGSINKVTLDADGKMRVLSTMASEDMIVLYKLTPAEKDPASEKKEIVIAGCGIRDTLLPALIDEMSILHPDVRYVLRDYRDDFEIPDGESEEFWLPSLKEVYEVMSLDLVSGNAPDIYYDPYNTLDLGELARLGYLLDLSPYVDKMDSSSYFLDQMKMGKQTPYEICMTFTISAFEASADYVKNPETWTYDDFYRSADGFADYQCIQTVYSRQSLLEKAILANVDKFIANREAKFTSEEYIRLLTWARDFGRLKDWEDYRRAELDDGLFMLDWASVDSLWDIISLGDHILVGWPDESGSIHMLPTNLLAVSSTCQNPDLAWDVLEYAVSAEYQTRYNDMLTEIPVNREAFRMSCDSEYKMAEEYHPENLKTEEEYVRAFEKQIGRADHIETGSRVILDICLEEALAFFDGQYSAEHAAELTRHRVQTYLDETS
ncbi:MAG: extracellular solute-binding protein [Clostridiales bacterium]|nr:extracellular solute-binding protein [Clostridiales bacterium]